MDFNFRGKGRFKFSNWPNFLVFYVFSVHFYDIGIWRTENFHIYDILALKLNSNVVGYWKETKIKSLEHVLFEVLFLNSTKIVEALNVSKVLAYLGFEIS